MSEIFDECVFCLSGKLLNHTRREFTNLVEDYGGEVKKSVTRAVTHLVTTESEIASQTSKVSKAIDNQIFIVNEDWVHESIDEDKKLPEVTYLLWDKTNKPTPKKKTGRKRKRKEVEDDEDDPKTLPKTERAGKKKKVKLESRKKVGGITLPCPDALSGYETTGEIFHEDDDIYNCMLNQTNISRNNNKFYQIQMIKTLGKDEYSLFTHWGRVGVRGQNACKRYNSKDKCISEFCKKFRAKTGNKWDDRDSFQEKSKKYTMIEISYEPDDDEDDLMKDEDDDKLQDEDEEEEEEVQCSLDERLQEFINRIADIREMKKTLIEMNIDITKMPLGKLSKTQIDVGFEVLKDLEDAINDGADKEELEELCNEFYTKVPQVFGMKRPPVIDSKLKVKKKVEMLESLRDMAVASRIIKETRNKVDPVTSTYEELHCELDPVDEDTEEWERVENYLTSTHGPTHSDYDLKLLKLFRCAREGEEEAYEKYTKQENLDNKMMLWHGSRTTNFMGILSEGLRIAPPSAPVTGYMFGKGIYLADMVSKSANYCRTSPTNNIGVCILAEAALGKPFEQKMADSWLDKNTIQAQGCDSTWGIGGTWTPEEKTHQIIDGDVKWPIGKPKKPKRKYQDSSLLYNEYVVYDEKQVKMKYILVLDFQYREIHYID